MNNGQENCVMRGVNDNIIYIKLLFCMFSQST
jgi:hypothetical protein